MDLSTQIMLVCLGVALVLDPSLLVHQVHLGSVPTWKELIFALSLAMLAYTGIETVANMAEESSDPGKQVPKAVNLVVLAVLAVYAGISVVALSALPVVHHGVGYSAALKQSFPKPGYATSLGGFFENDPMLGVVEHLGLHGTVLKLATYYLGLLAATILFIATNAGMIGISRLSWSLSEHRQLPQLFSKLHSKYRTPWFTMVFFSLLASTLILYGNTEVLGNLYSFGAMLSFTTAHAAIVKLRVNDPDRERPYKSPWGVRIKGAEIPMTAVIGGLGTAAAWVAVTVLHTEAKIVGIPWMVAGMGGYFYYRKRQGLDPRKSYRLPRAERPPDFAELGYRTALVPIFGEDVSAAALSSAAKLIGEDGVLYAVFVLPVPSQLSLEAGLEEEEAQGRSVLESARIQARRAGIKIHTGLIRTRNPGAALVEEAQRLHSDVIYWSTLHAPAGERRIGPTAIYLLSKRPCRVIIETEGPRADPREASPVPPPSELRGVSGPRRSAGRRLFGGLQSKHHARPLDPAGQRLPAAHREGAERRDRRGEAREAGRLVEPERFDQPRERVEFDQRARLDPLSEGARRGVVGGGAGQRALGAERFLDRGRPDPGHELALPVGERQREREVRQLHRHRGFRAGDGGGGGLPARFAVGLRELRRPPRASAPGSWR